jgi:hypothetical protein
MRSEGLCTSDIFNTSKRSQTTDITFWSDVEGLNDSARVLTISAKISRGRRRKVRLRRGSSPPAPGLPRRSRLRCHPLKTFIRVVHDMRGHWHRKTRKFNPLLRRREIVEPRICRGDVIGRGQAGSLGSGGASPLPAPDLPASTCTYLGAQRISPGLCFLGPSGRREPR